MRRRGLYPLLLLAVAFVSACTLFSDFSDLSNGPTGSNNNADSSPPDQSGEGDARVDIPPTDGGPKTDVFEAPLDAASCGTPGPTNGLVAYWTFDEGSGGKVHDCTSNHFDGVFVGNDQLPTNWVDGKRGKAIHVVQPNGCVDVGPHTAFQTTKITAAMWVKIDSHAVLGASGYIMGQAFNADVAGWRIASRAYQDAGSFSWQHQVGTTKYLFDVPAPPLNTWHHLAMTFEPDNLLEIFVDGTNVFTKSGTPAIDFTTASFRIGCRADSNNFFKGSIDEMRFYNRILSLAEIKELATP
jgi:arabinan endo-1,5-alpha-L-arabinosidase